MQEQQAEAERQRQNDTNRYISVADAVTECAHHNAGRERKAKQAPQRRQPDQSGAGGAGETDMRQRVTGKRLPAHHQKIADDARHHGDDAGGGESIGHEFILEHQCWCPWS